MEITGDEKRRIATKIKNIIRRATLHAPNSI
jgi:hypothetical protein